MSNSNPWPQNSAALRDCSQGICSIYCPQWCYIIYSPPPPSIILGDDNNNHSSSSGFEFSPLVVAVIGVLASAFILLIYYTIISRLCTRHRDNNNDQIDHLHHSELGQANSGLDETIIKSITVCKYEKRVGGGDQFVVEGSDCCVCLGEFQENESLRLLPKCNHAFHLPCIDTWLKSHSTCPLCRSIITMEPDASPSSNSNSNSITINALEYQQRRRDQVVILQSFEQPCLQQQQLVVVELQGSDNNIGSSRGTQGRYK